jgi:hypothetical protein
MEILNQVRGQNVNYRVISTRGEFKDLPLGEGRNVVKAVSSFSPRRPRFEPRSGHVVFVAEQVAPRQLSS